MSTAQPIRNMEELKRFKEYFKYQKPNARNYMLVITGLNTALRISDILHLTYSDIFDFEKRKWRTHIKVREQKTGKTNQIYINMEIRNAFEAYSDYSISTPADWLFDSQMHTGAPLSRYQAYRIIKEAATYAGLDSNISCHSLRKTFGYHAWKQGTPPVLLMNIYNHSTFQVTKRYLGIEQDDKDAVFEKIRL